MTAWRYDFNGSGIQNQTRMPQAYPLVELQKMARAQYDLWDAALRPQQHNEQRLQQLYEQLLYENLKG